MTQIKKLNDSYICVDSDVYEKIENETETFTLCFNDETYEKLIEMAKEGPWVNLQETIRHILREAMLKEISISDGVEAKIDNGTILVKKNENE